MKDYRFFVRANRPIAQDIYQMDLICWEQSFFEEARPGQFVHVKLPGSTAMILRRPVSIHSVDRDAKSLILQYAVVGQGTAEMAALAEGTELSVLGPIGNGYPLESHGRRVWLLGGGMGVAPLYSVAQYMHSNGGQVTAFLGWRDAAHAFGAEEFEHAGCKTHLYTDDGSFGGAGFAVNGLLAALERGEKPDVIYACGPLPLFRALAKELPAGIPCFVSLEERMGCGLGACLVCNCKIKTAEGTGYKRVCVDGPVFALSEVDFS